MTSSNGNEKPRSLADQAPGFRGRIVTVQSNGSVTWRLRELGFVPGTPVEVVRRGPLGDPVELELRGYRICLRRQDLVSLHVEAIAADRS